MAVAPTRKRPAGNMPPMQEGARSALRGRHVVLFNWRDTTNPEGGGSERYVEAMARGLVARGARATIFCAAHDRAPADEVVDGVRYVRRGDHARRSTSWGAAPPASPVRPGRPGGRRPERAAVLHPPRRPGQPVVVLVHHVHREQWPVVFPGTLGRVGWWIERRLAPLLYRRIQYIAVSRATRTS